MPKAVKKSFTFVHPLSRKALKLSRKEHHSEKVERRKEELNIKQQIKLKKLLWFKDHIDTEKSLYSAQDVLDLIDQYLHRFDEETEKMKEVQNIKGRKLTGRMKQDYSQTFMAERETQDFNTCGLEVPDLMNKKSCEMFLAWNGEPRYLTSIKTSTLSYTTLSTLIERQKAADHRIVVPEEGT